MPAWKSPTFDSWYFHLSNLVRAVRGAVGRLHFISLYEVNIPIYNCQVVYTYLLAIRASINLLNSPHKIDIILFILNKKDMVLMGLSPPFPINEVFIFIFIFYSKHEIIQWIHKYYIVLDKSYALPMVKDG